MKVTTDQALESDTDEFKIQIAEGKKKLEECELKIDEEITANDESRFQLIKSIIDSGGIPQYGPTSGDRCLSRGDDEAGRYTMKYSHQSYNKIEKDCEIRSGNEPDL